MILLLKKYLIAGFLVCLVSTTFAQTDFIGNIRNGDILRDNTGLFRYSSGRFVPVFVSKGLSHWSAPKNIVAFDGIPYEVFTLGLRSLNLVPFDLLDINSVSISGTHRTQKITSRYLNSDGDEFIFRMYLGQATGDALIHQFTRDKSFVNKNKIIPSYVLRFARKRDRTGFSLTGGYYGSYSTGFGTDEVIRNKSAYYYSKQNKQFLIRGSFDYFGKNGRKYLLNAGLITFYGWEIAPFIGSYSHMEIYNYRIRAGITNVFENLDVSFISDRGSTETNEGRYYSTIKYELISHSVIVNYRLRNESYPAVDFNLSVSNYSGNNLKPKSNAGVKNFFAEEFSELLFELSSKIHYKFVDDIHMNIVGNYKRGLSGSGLSGLLQLEYEYSNNSGLHMSLNKIVNFPSPEELYGSFDTYKPQSNLDDNSVSFTSRGNKTLQPAKVYSIELSHFLRKNNVFENSILLSYNFSRDQIVQRNNYANIAHQVQNSLSQNEVLRDFNYINTDEFNFFKGSVKFSYIFSRNAEVDAMYTYIDNTHVQYVPKHDLNIRFTLEAPFGGNFIFRYIYNSSRYFELVGLNSSAENNFLQENMTCNRRTQVDLFYSTKLSGVYFIDDLMIYLGIENLFNDRFKFLPFGNYFSRTAIASLKIEIK